MSDLIKLLSDEGCDTAVARTPDEARRILATHTPDVILCEDTPSFDALDLLRSVRQSSDTLVSTFIVLSSDRRRLREAYELGADDYVAGAWPAADLVALVRARLRRPPVPTDYIVREAQSGLLNWSVLAATLDNEISRLTETPEGFLALISFEELEVIGHLFGGRGQMQLARQIGSIITRHASRVELVASDSKARLAMLLPQGDERSVRSRLETISRMVAGESFQLEGERVRLTPVIGFAPLFPGATVQAIQQNAAAALAEARKRLDLHPVAYQPSMQSAAHPPSTKKSLIVPAQIFASFYVGWIMPFAVYLLLAYYGYDITGPVYIVVVIALAVTATLIWAEGFSALRRIDPPPPAREYPQASAVIAAYLPNEAATIVETLRAFLALDYPHPLQIILAYNTPRDLPIEAVLRQLSAENPNVILLRVQDSTSKATNINAALGLVSGEFCGIFDADHHPDPGSFKRAWQWLSNGYDVVQGHCVVRNGGANWVSRMVAVEFEAIYAVSHPGRSRLHGFGIFGGSNGYWRTTLLHETRMRGFMLTEDIDSSIRALQNGAKIISDPQLLSRELAPTTLQSLWHQRMRWAQGWFQVSARHLLAALRHPGLTVRQKLGLCQLLLWREVYSWLSMQIVPILALWLIWRRESVDWFVPIFVITTLFTLGTGPGQMIFVARLGVPEIRRRRKWLVFYAVVSLLFYTALKNLIARVAQIRELMGDRPWKITPRPT